MANYNVVMHTRQGPRFYPGQSRNLDRVFCSMRTAVRLWDHNIGDQSQSQTWKLT